MIGSFLYEGQEGPEDKDRRAIWTYGITPHNMEKNMFMICKSFINENKQRKIFIL